MERLFVLLFALVLSCATALGDPRRDCFGEKNERSIRGCTELIRANSKDAAAYHKRGAEHARAGNIERAVEDLNKAIQLEPANDEFYVTRAEARQFAGMTSGALQLVIADYTRAIDINPRHAQALSSRGYAYYAQGDFDRAIEDHTKAIGLEPQNDLFINERGLVYQTIKRYDLAARDFDEAIRLNPNFAPAYSNRGVVYRLQGDHAKAIEYFTRAISIDAKMGAAYFTRAASYVEVGDTDRAIADYRKVMALPAKSPGATHRRQLAEDRLARLLQPRPVHSGPRRIALVIGNSKYTHMPTLKNPANDAQDLAAALRRLNFTEVVERYDLDREAMSRALRDFGDTAEGAEWAVVFFAGHGMEMNGSAYLLPIDAELKRDTHVAEETISLTHVQTKVDPATKLGLVILDACRNNPMLARMVRTASRTRSLPAAGLSRVDPEGNVIVIYSAKHGTTADDGEGRNSPFTRALLTYIEEPGLEINFLFRNVVDSVRESTRRRQEPFIYGTFGRETLFFRPQ